MAIDLQSAITLGTRRYIAPTVVVVLLLATFSGYIWSEYRALLKEKDVLAENRKAFNDERLLFEKYRADTAIEFNSKKSELERREFATQQLELINKERLASLKETAGEYKLALEGLRQKQVSVSESQRMREAEREISKLMSEFSAMGINLNESLKCGDYEFRAKFNAAKAKYTEIYSLAQAYGLTERYQSFFFHNGQHVYSACED